MSCIVSTPDTLRGKPRIKGMGGRFSLMKHSLNLHQQIPCTDVYLRIRISVPLMFIAGS